MSIEVEKVHEIYNNIESLKKSALSPEDKAFKLRQIFESIFANYFNRTDSDEFISLWNLFNDYIRVSGKYEIKNIGRSLIKQLNDWAHYKQKKLDPNELDQYFDKFAIIVAKITDVAPHIKTNESTSVEDFFKHLNEEQTEAVNSREQIVLVNAGPGTGKTHLIVGRIIQQIKNNRDYKIFGLSFTNLAAQQLRERIDTILFNTSLFPQVNNIQTATLHSFAMQFIQMFHERNNEKFDFRILDEEDYQEIKHEFSDNKDLIESFLNDNKLLTFDKIILLFENMLEKNIDFHKFLGENINEIVIDEAQDLDLVQYQILYLLYQKIPNLKLFFVGDPRQNIYSFKGGSLEHFHRFFMQSVNKQIDLKLSYRCPENVLSFVNEIKFTDCINTPLHNAFNAYGNNINLLEFSSKREESIWIAELIREGIEKSNRYEDYSIIYPSSFYFKEISDALNDAKLPFKLHGGQTRLNVHIRLVRNILNAIDKNDFYSLNRITSFWGVSVKSKNINDVLNEIKNSKIDKNFSTIMSVLKFIQSNFDQKKLPSKIINEFTLLCEQNAIFESHNILLINDLYGLLQEENKYNDFNQLQLSFSPLNPQFEKFYEKSDDIVKCHQNIDSGYITLTTIHSAKGLEWGNVIIPGLSQEAFPRYFPDAATAEKELPNELKKFYVACTRTRKNLYFTRPKNMEVFSKKNNQYYSFAKEASIFVKNIKQGS